jgi:acetylornithine deacetylase/succinyl-diaminopimelate desuccinylase-like protein
MAAFLLPQQGFKIGASDSPFRSLYPSMTDLNAALAAADANFDDSLERLFGLLRIQSISTDPAYAPECRRAGQWLVDELNSVWALMPACATPPVIRWSLPITMVPRPDAPHYLFYGHYDVQPVDPLDLWTDPPFEPAIKEIEPGRKAITGRGAADDKGQLMTFVEACRAWKAASGALPCRITILFEVRKRSPGSPSLKPFLEANAEELKAECALVCDTGMWDAKTPAISVGLRGLVGEEVTIHAADRDLHSGLFGGAAANPLHILSKILADLHDETGRVTLEGFL